MPLYIYGRTEFTYIFFSLLHINVHFMFDIARYGASFRCVHILCLSTGCVKFLHKSLINHCSARSLCPAISHFINYGGAQRPRTTIRDSLICAITLHTPLNKLYMTNSPRNAILVTIESCNFGMASIIRFL